MINLSNLSPSPDLESLANVLAVVMVPVMVRLQVVVIKVLNHAPVLVLSQALRVARCQFSGVCQNVDLPIFSARNMPLLTFVTSRRCAAAPR